MNTMLDIDLQTKMAPYPHSTLLLTRGTGCHLGHRHGLLEHQLSVRVMGIGTRSLSD